MKPAPRLYPSTSFCLSLSQATSPIGCFSAFSVRGCLRPSEWSLPMWLSSPQGTAQVSRLGWRIQAQSVTNAFGCRAGPWGTLFHCSVETWQQSPQELFKWEKLYQSQPVLLRTQPSLLNHTFKTRWSFVCLFPSLALPRLTIHVFSIALLRRPAQSFWE